MSSDQHTTTELLHRLEEAQRVAHVGSFGTSLPTL
jgi:hypothetical protein